MYTFKVFKLLDTFENTAICSVLSFRADIAHEQDFAGSIPRNKWDKWSINRYGFFSCLYFLGYVPPTWFDVLPGAVEAKVSSYS